MDELIAPHPDSVNQVHNWLASHGITESDLSRSASGDWVKVKVPVSLAEKMLDTVREPNRLRKFMLIGRIVEIPCLHPCGW